MCIRDFFSGFMMQKFSQQLDSGITSTLAKRVLEFIATPKSCKPDISVIVAVRVSDLTIWTVTPWTVTKPHMLAYIVHFVLVTDPGHCVHSFEVAPPSLPQATVNATRTARAGYHGVKQSFKHLAKGDDPLGDEVFLKTVEAVTTFFDLPRGRFLCVFLPK